MDRWQGGRSVPQPGHVLYLQGAARDSAGNWSEMSDPFAVTTPAAEATDPEPPTLAPGLWGGVIDGATEAMVSWGNSTDNATPKEHIRY